MEKNNRHRELVALTIMPNLGSHRIRQLLKHFESPKEVFTGDVRKIRQIDGLGPVIASEITLFNQWDQVDRILQTTKRIGARLITFDDPEYPPLLRQIYDPPALLWVKGDPAALSKPGLAVIGTRRADRYGQKQAEVWSRRVIRTGLSVISGLAFGVDTIAHRISLMERGTTVAVLGSGIDWIYPSTNGKLAARIIENGGVLATEFPPGTKPDANNFPVRNRIVSGICLGVLVIQSGVKGGSMITARLALDQNREVFVVPHNLDQKKGEGNHFLIRTGQGKLVESMDDILCEIPFEDITEELEPVGSEKTWESKELSADEKEICMALAEGLTQIDSLAEKTGRSTFDLLPVLLDLEMDGVVVQSAGKYFELK